MDQDDVLAVFDAFYAAACVERDAPAAVGLFVDDADISFSGSDLAEHATTKAELLAIMRSESLGSIEAPRL